MPGERYQRIMIVGSGGSGKSTLARKLGQQLGLPVIHLDRLFWGPGWTLPDAADWVDRVAQAAAGERWVIDGNYSGTLPERLARADTVVFLDLPRWLCLRNIILRSIHNLGRTRDDMGSGCPDRLDLEFIQWVWNYPIRSRRRTLESIAELGAECEVHRFVSWRQADSWLSSL